MALAQATAPDPPEVEPQPCSSRALTADQWTMVEANTGLISWTITRYWSGFTHQWDDLFQDGFFGLTKAVTNYDPTKGKFSTHAVWWIRASISRGRDVAEGSGYRRARATGVHWDPPTSLDQPAFDDRDGTLADTLVDPDLRTDPPPDEAIVAAEIARAACRTDFERAILDCLADGRGAVQAALDIGYSRSSASKTLSRLRDRIHAGLAALTPDERAELAATILGIEEVRL